MDLFGIEKRIQTLGGDSFLVKTPHFLAGPVMEANIKQQQEKFNHEKQEEEQEDRGQGDGSF